MCLKPSNVPRVCRPWSVQLATTRAGAVILEKSAAFERQKSSIQRMFPGLGFEIFDLAFAGAPAVPERRPEVGIGNSAMGCDLAIAVGPAFPRIDGGKMRRIEFGDPPLQLRQIGNAGQSDLAVAPGLRAGPFDQIVEILRFLRRQKMRGPFRVPGTADVDVHDRVAVGHPEHRVGRLERGVLRRVAFLHAGVEEASRIERHVFAVRAPGDDRRHRPLVGGPVRR